MLPSGVELAGGWRVKPDDVSFRVGSFRPGRWVVCPVGRALGLVEALRAEGAGLSEASVLLDAWRGVCTVVVPVVSGGRVLAEVGPGGLVSVVTEVVGDGAGAGLAGGVGRLRGGRGRG